MNQQKQTGSAHVVVIVVLIIALVGALGFVFWQNFVNKYHDTEQTHSTSKESTPEVKLKVAQIDELFPVKLSWSYPEDWTITSKGSGPKTETETTEQIITLTSPSKDYEVAYRVGSNGSYGGSCSPEDAGTLQYVRRESIVNFSKAIFLESIADNYSVINSQKKFEGYLYGSGLANNEDRVTNAEVGDSTCVLPLSGIRLSNISDTVLLSANIKIKKVETTDQYGDTQPIKDTATITKAYDSKEYKDAIAILKSTQLKE